MQADREQINLSDFAKKVNMGIITPQKVGKNYILAIKRFDPDTGVEIEPHILPISIDKLEAEISLLAQRTQATIVQMREIISVLKALDEAEDMGGFFDHETL